MRRGQGFVVRKAPAYGRIHDRRDGVGAAPDAGQDDLDHPRAHGADRSEGRLSEPERRALARQGCDDDQMHRADQDQGANAADEQAEDAVDDAEPSPSPASTPAAARPATKVWFAVDVEAHAVPTAEPTKQDQRAPIKMVGGRAWSPGIYQALRLLGKSLDVAWERAFIHPLTFN